MRGGQRPGAGRKPAPEKKTKVQVYLSPELYEMVKMLAEEDEVTMSKEISHALDRYYFGRKD